MLTRDSWLWKLLFWGGSALAAVVEIVVALDPASAGSLGLSPALMAQVRLVYAIVIGVSGKLGLSWLPKSDDKPTVNPSRWVGPAILLVMVPGLVAGCSAKTKPALAKADYALYQSVKAISDTEIVLSRAGALTPAQSLRINEALLPAAKLGMEATQALRAWQPGQPLPPQIPRLVKELGDVSRVIVEIVAQPEARAGLLEKVGLAQQAILAIVALGVIR
jgi:hypothetical protein